MPYLFRGTSQVQKLWKHSGANEREEMGNKYIRTKQNNLVSLIIDLILHKAMQTSSYVDTYEVALQ